MEPPSQPAPPHGAASPNLDSLQTVPPRYPVVEVTSTMANETMHIHVKCMKRRGLLERLIGAMEAIGLLLLEADIAIQDGILRLDVVGTKEGDEILTMDADMLQICLIDIILNVNNGVHSNNHVNIPTP